MIRAFLQITTKFLLSVVGGGRALASAPVVFLSVSPLDGAGSARSPARKRMIPATTTAHKGFYFRLESCKMRASEHGNKDAEDAPLLREGQESQNVNSAGLELREQNDTFYFYRTVCSTSGSR